MLMKHLAGLLLFLSSVIGLCAQTNDAWEAYLAYHETTRKAICLHSMLKHTKCNCSTGQQDSAMCK